MTRILRLEGDTPLVLNAIQWVKDTADGDGYSEGEVVRDLLNSGCVSGMVRHLITWRETEMFYSEHKTEINKLLYESLDSTGLSISDLFGDNWDKTDPLALGGNNQNLLAWFGFEETVRKLADEAGIDV